VLICKEYLTDYNPIFTLMNYENTVLKAVYFILNGCIDGESKICSDGCSFFRPSCTLSDVVCTLLQRSVNPLSRTLALPFHNRLQSTPIPSNFYTLDEVSLVAAENVQTWFCCLVGCRCSWHPTKQPLSTSWT